MNAKETKALGHYLCVGFDGAALPTWVKRCIENGKIGGIILFKRNIKSLEQTARLIAEAKEASPDSRLVVAVDQEGGRVARLCEPFPKTLSAAKLAAINDLEFTRAAYRTNAVNLKSLGFTLNLAPVADVCPPNPETEVISDRSFGSNPEIVSRHVAAAVKGLRDGGICACAKHFPGHGKAKVDSHKTLPALNLREDEIFSQELPPFEAAIGAEVDSVMSGHLLVKSQDDTFPATFSKKILQGLLRQKLGFKGAIISDDMEMGAVAEVFGGREKAAAAAISAGCDMLLLNGFKLNMTGERDVDTLINAIKSKRCDEALTDEQIEASARRADRLKG